MIDDPKSMLPQEIETGLEGTIIGKVRLFMRSICIWERSPAQVLDAVSRAGLRFEHKDAAASAAEVASPSSPMSCSFCRSTDGPHVYTVEDFEGNRPRFEKAYVECEECGSKGPDCDSEVKAIQIWNAPRHSPAGKEPLPDWKQDQADTSVMPRKPLLAVTALEIAQALFDETHEEHWDQGMQETRAIYLEEAESLLAKYEVRRRT